MTEFICADLYKSPISEGQLTHTIRLVKKMNKISLEKLPAQISVEVAEAFIEHRKTLKKPLTQRAFDLNMKEALKAIQYGIKPDDAIDESIMNGWQGVKAEWAANKIQNKQETQAKRINAPYNAPYINTILYTPGRLSSSDMQLLSKNGLIMKRAALIRRGQVNQSLREFVEHCEYLGIETN